jgi:hypothetical protein
VPKGHDWPSLLAKDGDELQTHYRHVHESLGKRPGIFSDFAHGSKGSAVLRESLAAAKPRIYKGQVQTRENEVWRCTRPKPNNDGRYPIPVPGLTKVL